MITIKETNNFEYTVKGFFADMSESMEPKTAYGLEDAIETARAEWCEEQDEAVIYDADGMTAAWGDRCGRIYLAGGWEIEIA